MCVTSGVVEFYSFDLVGSYQVLLAHLMNSSMGMGWIRVCDMGSDLGAFI